MPQFNDDNLLEGLIQGDSEAFDSLITLYQDKVVNTCTRFVYDHQEAEDVAQDVFIEIYQSVDNFRGQSKLSTWIYRIAVTKSLDYMRKKTRKKRMGKVKRLFGMDSEDETKIDLQDDSPTPDEIFDSQEQAKILNQAINSLPENQRTAIILSNFEQLSQSEVSQIMGNTVSAVESLIFRAKKNLKHYLSKYYEKNLP